MITRFGSRYCLAAALAVLMCLIQACTTVPQQELRATASIGASIGVDKNGWLYLVNFVEGGPAANHGGLIHGDRLVGIKQAPEDDFTMVHELDRQQVIEMIQGPEGSPVYLWLVRDFKSEYVTLTRARLKN